MRIAFSPKNYFRFLAQGVSAKEIRKRLKNTPDHCHYDWDYASEVISPLETGEFPTRGLPDLIFALENLLVDLESAPIVNPHSNIYLASIFLYTTQLEPRGMGYESLGVTVGLEASIASGDKALLEIFADFLEWLIHFDHADEFAETEFLFLGLITAQSELFEPPQLPPDLRHKLRLLVVESETRLRITDSSFFLRTWPRLLKKFRHGEAIREILLRLS